MTDSTDYTAKIRAKGLDGTGFTEQLAAELFNRVGHTMSAIVELQVVDKHGPNIKGQRGIELVLTRVEPAESIDLEEHLQELARVGYLNRQQSNGQLAIDQSLGQERTVADVLAAGKSLRSHPFLPDDASKDQPICDVCGGIEASAVHSTQEVLDDPDGAEEDESDEAGDGDELPEWERDLLEREKTTRPLSSVPDPFGA